MISFRYHLVSIIAVFLALALGIVVGTTALNGPITTDLRKQVNTLKSDRSNLAQQVKTLQGQLGDAGAFADAFGANIVNGTLNKQKVLLIAMPGASSTTRDGVAKEIAAAGGTISGQVEIAPSYIDQRRSQDILSLATTDHPIGLKLTTTSDPGILGGELLAFVLTGLGQETDLSQVITAFSELHMLSVASNSTTSSKTIVVVGTGALPQNDYRSQMELSLVTALQTAGAHVVVAGNADSASQAGLVAAVRGSGADKTTVSTVDNADTAIGQVSTVLALAESTNIVGHYGSQKSAQAPFPTPVK